MSDKRILITGGSRGIGRAMVEVFAAAGHRVAFTYLHSADAAQALAACTGAIAMYADAAREEDIVASVRQAHDMLGGIDCLVNNAGVSLVGLLTDMSYEQITHTLSVDLTAALVYAREVLRYMIPEKRGAIVNVTSMWGIVGASCEVVYSAAKAGMIGMTRALAKEVGPSGITVNAIAPGVIDTDMNGDLGADDMAALCEQTPLGRIGTPEEIARIALFLMSKDAAFMTGTVLNASGGFVSL